MELNSLFSLEGKSALVTGGSAGIGRMIAAAFISAGATVYIASRNEARCNDAARELGNRCIALPQDLSTVAGCTALAVRLEELQSELNILVNNAGAAWGADFESFPEAGWDKVLNLNLKSPFFLTQRLHGLLKAAASPEHPAKVINIASVDGLRLSSWETYSYHTSKAAMIHLTRRMAARLVRDNINVTAIAPGDFASNMNRAAREHEENVGRVIPQGRIGRPADMGAAAIFLAAASGDYIVGETLAVDGGLAHAQLSRSNDA